MNDLSKQVEKLISKVDDSNKNSFEEVERLDKEYKNLVSQGLMKRDKYYIPNIMEMQHIYYKEIRQQFDLRVRNQLSSK